MSRDWDEIEDWEESEAREAFEAWQCETWDARTDCHRNGWGEYSNARMQHEWQAWLAATRHFQVARLAAENRELRAALDQVVEECLPIIEAGAESTPQYGQFIGGDPRAFRPDREVAFPAEIERWESDCAAWESGKQVHSGGYGPGTFDAPCPFHADALKALHAAREALRAKDGSAAVAKEGE